VSQDARRSITQRDRERGAIGREWLEYPPEVIGSVKAVSMKASGQHIAAGICLGLFFFGLDWVGYDKWQPRLFMGPRNFWDIWWHLPVAIVAGLAIVLWRLRSSR
jgi:hypothetical protein